MRSRREVEHGHVLAEDHVVGGAIEEASRIVSCCREDPFDTMACLVERADVCGGLAQRASNRLADLVRNLRSSWRVEEDEIVCNDENRRRAA